MLDGDKLKNKIIKWYNKKNNVAINQFSSVDGIFPFYENSELKLFFVEFKHFSIKDKKNFQKIIVQCKNELKLKSFETLNCVFPHLIDRFCTNESYLEKEEELISLFYNCSIAYICVINEHDSPNKYFSQHIKNNQDIFDLKKLSKHPFTCVEIMGPNLLKIALEKKEQTQHN